MLLVNGHYTYVILSVCGLTSDVRIWLWTSDSSFKCYISVHLGVYSCKHAYKVSLSRTTRNNKDSCEKDMVVFIPLLILIALH